MTPGWGRRHHSTSCVAINKGTGPSFWPSDPESGCRSRMGDNSDMPGRKVVSRKGNIFKPRQDFTVFQVCNVCTFIDFPHAHYPEYVYQQRGRAYINLVGLLYLRFYGQMTVRKQMIHQCARDTERNQAGSVRRLLAPGVCWSAVWIPQYGWLTGGVSLRVRAKCATTRKCDGQVSSGCQDCLPFDRTPYKGAMRVDFSLRVSPCR